MAQASRDFISTLRAYLMRLVLVLMVAVAAWGISQNPPAWLVTAIKRYTEKPPAWPNDYAKAQAQAKAEHKLIFLSFTGSDWCYYCQQFDKYVLDTPVFRDYAAKNLVLVEVDVPQHHRQPAALQAQNEKLVMKYDVHGFPTTILINSDGKELLRTEGYDDASGPKSFITQIDSTVKRYTPKPAPPAA